MKMKILIGFAVLSILSGWICQDDAAIRQAGWLIGTWENKTAEGSIFETWNRHSNLEFSGKSYMLKGKDSLVFETVTLRQEGKVLYYIPRVKDQNNGSPVIFTSKHVSANKLIFENPAHDFPQKISYTKVNADSLVAEISGTFHGKESKEMFPMRRVR